MWLCLFWCVSFKSRNVKKNFLGRLSAKKGKQENNMYICYELCVIFDRSNYCRHMERENKNKSIQFISTGVLIFLYDLESQMSGTRSKKSNLPRWTNSLRSFSKITYSKVWCVSFLKDNSQWKFKINFWLKVLWHALIKAQPTSQKVVWPWIKIEVVFISCI